MLSKERFIGCFNRADVTCADAIFFCFAGRHPFEPISELNVIEDEPKTDQACRNAKY